MSRSLGVVVPAYKPEVDRLLAYVEALDERLSPDELRVELDAPRPGVVEALRASAATVSVAERRRGKGTAITAGFEALSTDVLAFADADGSTPAEFVERIVSPVLDDEADLAVGSRRHPDSVVVSHQTFARRRLGDGFALLARGLLDVPLYDYQCGAKAISRETWASVREHLYEPGFAWDIELVAVAGAFDGRVVEVPVRWEDQPGSTVSPLRDGFRLGRGLLSSRHRARIVRENRFHRLIENTRESRPSLLERLAGAEESGSD